MHLQHLATGIFMWSAPERRTDRYGSFFMATESYNDEKPGVPVVTHTGVFEALLGKRVRVVIKVIENRPSGHVGDETHGLKPDPLPAGESIELAIGTLRARVDEWGSQLLIIEPDILRARFWIDPRKLYRLHDQTVEVYAQKSRERAHPVFEGRPTIDNEAVAVEDGVFQIKTRSKIENLYVPSVIEDQGGGMMFVSRPSMKRGSRHILQPK